MAVEPALLVELLQAWGLPADETIAAADRGTNNKTFLVGHQDARRFVLRISENLSAPQVRAEHRLLGRLRRAGLPFEVPEPVATRDRTTVIETTDGPATLCRWLPGVRPDLDREPALERFGRAVAILGAAMRRVPLADAPQDWRGAPLPVRVDGTHGEDLWRELRAAGVRAEHAALLDAAARRVTRWWAGAVGTLPVQLVHGDLAASNALADQETGEITALLDFEIAGAGFRVQDFMVTLYQCGALESPQWQRRTAALLRGYSLVRRLTAAEVEALPELVLSRSLGTALWRAGRWRRGQAELAEVIDRIEQLEATVGWLAACGAELVSIVAAAGCGRSMGGPDEAAARYPD